MLEDAGMFQSTHSLRSATYCYNAETEDLNVSIHALLAECDVKGDSTPFTWSSFNPRTPCGVRLFETWSRMTAQGFNPRTPCGVRRLPLCILRLPSWFQSTHSLRSATIIYYLFDSMSTVSIHALLAECDCARPYTWLLNRANHTLRQPP